MKYAYHQIKLALFFILFVTGCQLDLYKGLNEQEANQMLALLLINQISAQKVAESSGTLKLKVAEKDFVNAVEILRQNGYPKRRFLSVNELFPVNQLVTSPVQEQAKITYLKEQHLEQLLSTMEGVVSASVAIAASPPTTNRRDATAPAASILIKYSPETNMAYFVNQIKSLIRNSIPGINYDAITVVLQASSYRFLQAKPTTTTLDIESTLNLNALPPSGKIIDSNESKWIKSWIHQHKILILLCILWIVIGIVVVIMYFRKNKLNHEARNRPSTV